eukprot:5260641-Pyramimonas_sp.AAC.1
MRLVPTTVQSAGLSAILKVRVLHPLGRPLRDGPARLIAIARLCPTLEGFAQVFGDLKWLGYFYAKYDNISLQNLTVAAGEDKI